MQRNQDPVQILLPCKSWHWILHAIRNIPISMDIEIFTAYPIHCLALEVFWSITLYTVLNTIIRISNLASLKVTEI